MKKLSLALAIAASGLAAAPAMAQHADHGPMGQHPTNRAELEKKLAEHFAMLDANKDGVVSPDERKAEHERMQAQMFKAADSDGDGKLSMDEMKAMHAAHMGAGPRPGAMAMDRPGKGKLRDKAMARREAMMSRSETREQFMNRRLAMFDRVDTNHDGTISDAERKAMMAKMRGRGAPDQPPPPPPAG